jgi:hypothetical protein
MQVSAKDLTVWSFLMASAHGAGLMVVPIVLSGTVPPHAAHTAHAMQTGAWPAVWATALHSAGYLAVSAAVALVVFEKLGLGLLRKAWLNLDLVWGAALIATGIITVAAA